MKAIAGSDSRLHLDYEVGAIVVCRMDSSRLPGKALLLANHKPLLAFVTERLDKAGKWPGRLIVATTDRPVDDPIVQFCRGHHLEFFRGSAQNVAGRVLACALQNGLDWFARVNGDSPFVDIGLLNRACCAAETGRYDLITNLSPRTFPYGVSVELVRVDAYEQAFHKMTKGSHLEHVTKYMYDHREEFRYCNLQRDGDDLSHFRLTVDTEADWLAFRGFAEQCTADWRSVTYLDAIEKLQFQRMAE